MKRYDVYGIGNALVDILAEVDDAFLNKVFSHPYPSEAGHTKGSMTLVHTDFQGHLLRMLESHTLHTVSGGSGCNTMVGMAHLGARVKYVGKVGNDVHGALYADDLHNVGVHFDYRGSRRLRPPGTRYLTGAPLGGTVRYLVPGGLPLSAARAAVDHDIPRSTETTGTCVVLITPDAQRTMFTHLGCSTTLSPDDIDEAGIRASEWIYLEGYLWDPPGPRAASIKAMQIAKQHGVKVAYSFSDAFCVRRAREDFYAFTKEYVDLVFCNEDEALAFTGASHVDTAITAIRELNTGVAVTRGREGSVVALNGTVHQVPAVTVTAIDTTGAGDLYAAGLLHGLCQGHDILAAGTLAAQVAAQVVTIRGPRLPR